MEKIKGAFIGSLKRNNKQIKDDRAQAIAEDTEIAYKRTVEDLQYQVKRLKRDRNNMMDLSPTNAQSLMMASDFDSKKFVEEEIKFGVEIRNLEIKLEIAASRYYVLFGEILPGTEGNLTLPGDEIRVAVNEIKKEEE